MINNVLAKKKAEKRKVYIDIGDDSREVLFIRWDSSERNPVGVVAGAH